MRVFELNGKWPRIRRRGKVFEGAIVAGDVVIEELAVVGLQTVVYAENDPVRIGKEPTVADGAVVHAKGRPVEVNDPATVGHGAQICGGSAAERAHSGINAVVLDDAKFAELSLLASDSLLFPGKETTPHTRWGGRPARAVLARTPDEIDRQVTREQGRTTVFDSLRACRSRLRPLRLGQRSC